MQNVLLLVLQNYRIQQSFNHWLSFSSQGVSDCKSYHFWDLTMRQHHLVAPLQLIAALLAVLFMAVVSPKASTQIVFKSDEIVAQKGVDPVVTGQTVSTNQLEGWKAKRDRFLKCGLCGNVQPFPEDLDD